MNNKKLFCINCNKNNHSSKDCKEPVFSYGIICVNLEPELNISPTTIENYLINRVIDFEEYNFSNLTNLSKLDTYKNKITFYNVLFTNPNCKPLKFGLGFFEYILLAFDYNYYIKHLGKKL